MSGKPDPYADIDFEEINDQTNLANDEIKCLKVGGYLYLFLGKIFNQWSPTQVCFDLFDTKKQDFLSADDLGEIMRAMGFRPTEEELVDLLHEVDEDGWAADQSERRVWPRDPILISGWSGPARSSSGSSASCAPHSSSRIPTSRPWRRSWRTPSGSVLQFLHHCDFQSIFKVFGVPST